MTITRKYVSPINNAQQEQAQINDALTNVYDYVDKNALGGTVTKVSTGTGLTGGPITGTGTVSMADTAVTAGSYTAADITVDKQGRITKAASHSLTTGTVTNVATGTGLTGGPITATGTVAVDQASTLHWTGPQTFDKPITPALTFATLPATPTPGQRALITDASAATFASKAAGGGANEVPLTYTTALGWIIG